MRSLPAWHLACLSGATDSWRTVAPSNRKASPGGRLCRQATSVKPTCYFGRRVIVKGRWMNRERWKVKEGCETAHTGESARTGEVTLDAEEGGGGWERRGRERRKLAAIPRCSRAVSHSRRERQVDRDDGDALLSYRICVVFTRVRWRDDTFFRFLRRRFAATVSPVTTIVAMTRMFYQPGNATACFLSWRVFFKLILDSGNLRVT